MSTVTQQISNYPNLPFPLKVGSLRWTDKLEDYPSGEILYKGCALGLANSIAAAYPNLTPVTIEGIGFVVMPSGVSVKRSRFGRGDIETYEVSVQLDSKWKAKCQRRVNLAPFLQRDLFSRFRYASGVNVAAIAAFLGINYNGPAIFYSPEQTETTFEEILKSNCRRLGCFVDFSSAIDIKLARIDGTANWSFPDSVVIDSGSDRGAPVLPTMDRVSITGKFSKDPFDEQNALLLPIEPYREVMIQGREAGVLTAAEANGRLTTLDLNFDVSGPKKVYTETYMVDGITVKEVVKIYGFMYRAVDVGIYYTVGGKITFSKFDGNPTQWWQQVEERVTEFTYETIEARFNILITNENKRVSLYSNPDSANAVRVDSSGVTLDNAKYLLGSTVTGWKYVRFQKEDNAKQETKFLTPPAVSAETYNTKRYAAELCTFRRVPIDGRSGFEAEAARSKYPLSTPLPFSIEVKKYTEVAADTISRANIPPRYVLKNGQQVIDESYVVGIVTANPTDSEPYWLKSETNFLSCFAKTLSPTFNPYLGDNLLAKRLRGNYDPEYIFTGEENYSSVVRSIFEYNPFQNTYGTTPISNGVGQKDFSEFYEEVTFSDNAQGANFLEVANDALRETKKGKPPIAQVQLKKWGTAREKARIEGRGDAAIRTYQKYYASSDLLDVYPADIVLRYSDSGQIDLPYCNTVAEAKTALETDLRMVAIANSVGSKKIAWYYPTIRAGDKVQFSTGMFRCNSVSNSLEFRGLQNNTLVVVSEGTQVEVGYDKTRTVSITAANFSRNSNNEIAPEVKVTPSTTGTIYGNFVYNTSRRRG